MRKLACRFEPCPRRQIKRKECVIIILDEDKLGYIYKSTNKVNGRYYIGQHRIIKDEPWLRYLGSGKLILQAIEKYGKDNFTKELIAYGNTPEELNEIEINEIRAAKAKDGIKVYNIAMTILPNPHILKLSNSELKKRMKRSQKKAYEAANRNQKAKRLEAKETHRELILTVYIYSNSIKRTAKEIQDEYGLKDVSQRMVREVVIEAGYDLSIPHNKGKRHSEETKRKISETMKNKHKKQKIN